MIPITLVLYILIDDRLAYKIKYIMPSLFLFFTVFCGNEYVTAKDSQSSSYDYSGSVAGRIAGGHEDPLYRWPSAAIIRSYAPFPNCQQRRCGVCTGRSLK